MLIIHHIYIYIYIYIYVFIGSPGLTQDLMQLKKPRNIKINPNKP